MTIMNDAYHNDLEQQRMSKDDVPEWAMDRAASLMLVETTPSRWQHAFARYIAVHEPAPVDPLAAILVDAFNATRADWFCDDLTRFTAELRARLPDAALAAIDGRG